MLPTFADQTKCRRAPWVMQEGMPKDWRHTQNEVVLAEMVRQHGFPLVRLCPGHFLPERKMEGLTQIRSLRPKKVDLATAFQKI